MGTMQRIGGPNVPNVFGPGGPLTAQLCVEVSPGGPVSWGDHRKCDTAISRSDELLPSVCGVDVEASKKTRRSLSS